MMKHLQELADTKALIGKSFQTTGQTYTVQEMDNFEYVDPIDKSVAKNQVSSLILCFNMNSDVLKTVL